MCQPMNDYRMATHLVRWWKTKILSGYKQFTAVLPTECGDGRSSDTEELLRPDCDPPPTTPPLHHVKPPHPPSTPQEPPKRELNFEGFECDVSLEGAGDPSDRQEFSFTLYDFDGHGKITKDDIAGLVTTIYDTLGSTIRVPHYGSKTIKVKLTVAPDTSPPTGTAPGSAPPPAQPRRYKRDLNVTIRERRRRHTRRHSISSSAASEDREADVSEEEDEPSRPPNSRLQPPHTNSCRQSAMPSGLHSRSKKRSSSLQRQELLQIIQANMEKNNLCFKTSSCRQSAMPSGLHSRSKKRSSSLQRQELLQIIQANMEKNNLCFKTSRKHFSPGHDPSRHKAPPHWDKSGGRGRGRGEVPPPPQSPLRSAPTTTSPHHLKHRHREEEQARAMAQVVRWLEQEFSPPRGSFKQKSSARTEHHHVHEHVHHHYHHYQDTPVLV